jgi:two-component system cell cycle response regulator DivK
MPKILVVEDMPDSADLAAQILRNYGHSVTIAETGERGLALAAEHQPDLIVYDYWLPDLDARTFLTRLRANPGLQAVKIIVCTATPKEILSQSLGEDYNFDGYILKPYRLTNFMQEVEAQFP